jgi:hypothetical protein
MSSPQEIIDRHMRQVAQRVIDVFENADEDATADDIMQDVFEAIGLVEAFRSPLDDRQEAHR